MNSDELGLVIFEINGFNYTSVINDAHSLLYITLPMGINNLTVYYDGDAKYDSADAVNTKIIVKSKVDSNIVIDDVLLDIGDSVVFTAKINDVSCDDVVFMINGVENNSISNVSAGNYIVTAIFYGNSLNKANSTSKVFNVKKIDTSIDVAHKLISTAVDLSAGEPGSNIYAILKDVNSNILANKTIQCSINGVKTNYVSDNQGRIILKSNFQEAKTYNLLFSFEGDEKYTSSSSSLKLTVTKKITSLSASTKKFKKSKKIKRFTVVLKTSKNINGKTYLKSGKKISLRVNKKIYTAKTNSKGQATFKINKLNKKGKFAAKIVFSGDVTYSACSKSVKIIVK